MRLLHISDIHIGPNSAARVYHALSRPISGRSERLDVRLQQYAQGVAGHDDPVCLALFDTIDELIRQASGPVLPVVTGDLTAYGHDDQFREARDMLNGKWNLGGVENLGFPFRGEWERRTIPGNHDHWSGAPLPVGSGSRLSRLRTQFRKTFHHLPHYDVLGGGEDTATRIGAGWTLRMLRVDTDDEIGHIGRKRARGRCSGHVQALTQRLSTLPRKPKELRVLLLHVPYAEGRSGPDEELVLDDHTREQIEALGQAHRIHVFLTGHIHEPALDPISGFAPGAFQARAGSCCQALVPAYPGAPTPPVNTFMVHDLEPDHDSLVWTTTVYRYSHRAFVPVTGYEPGLTGLAPFTATFSAA